MACLMLFLVSRGMDMLGQDYSTGKHAGRCHKYQQLKEWEIRRYRDAVDGHRQDLSRQAGRCVGWAEAAKDFCRRECVDSAEQWRMEYCGLICPARKACLLALHFMQTRHEDLLHRAG